MSRRYLPGGSRRRASGRARTPVVRRAVVCVAAVALIALAGTSAAAQEIVAGGEARVMPSVTISPRLPERILPLIRTEYTALISVYGPAAELTAKLGAWHELPVPGAPGLQAAGAQLNELRLTTYPSDSLVVDVGRFVYQPGRALLVSPNNLYTTFSLENLLRGDLASAALPTTMARARLFAGPFYFALTFVPAPNVPQLVEPGSIWAPRMPLDETIDDPRLAPDPVTLGDVYVEPTRPVPEHYARVSGGVEAGTTVGPVDVTLLYYHGVDPSPVPRARVDFETSPPVTYDLFLAPDEAVIDSIGLVAEAFTPGATFWLDASFVPNKTLATTNVDAYYKRTILEVAPTLAGVAGASHRLASPDLLLLAEYYHAHSFLPADVPESDLIKPTLSSNLAVSARLAFGAESRLSLTTAGILAFADYSGVATLNMEFAPSDSLRFTLAAPLFLGPPDSDFGQYRDIIQLSGLVEYRF